MNLPPRRGLALTIIGAVLAFVVAPAIFGITTWVSVKQGIDKFDRTPTLAAGATFDAKSTGTYVLMVEGDQNSVGSTDCTVTGPDGSLVPTQHRSSTDSTSQGSNTYIGDESFDARTTGGYVIDCGAPTKVLDKKTADDLFKGILVPIVIAVAVAGLVFVLGAVLFIVGIVKLVRSGRERREARNYGGPGNYPYGGGPGGPYPGGPYGGGPGNPGGPYGGGPGGQYPGSQPNTGNAGGQYSGGPYSADPGPNR